MSSRTECWYTCEMKSASGGISDENDEYFLKLGKDNPYFKEANNFWNYVLVFNGR